MTPTSHLPRMLPCVRYALAPLFGLFLVLGSLTSCSSTQPEFIWLNRYLEATSTQDERRWDEAMVHYEQLLAHTPDPERRRMVRYRIATLYEDKGEQAKALALYKEVMAGPESDDWGARSMYRVYTLEQDQRLLPTILLRYGNTTAAQHAIMQMRAHAIKDATVPALLDQWASLQGEVRGDAQDFLLFWRAKVAREEVGRGDEAIGLWQQVIDDYEDEGLVDDAIWEIANTLDAQQKWGAALAMYERLATNYQAFSFFLGDYNSEHADNARWRQAEILLERGQTDEAIAHWRLFLSEFPHNRMADDAAWQIVSLEARASGDMGERTRGLELFISTYPESRHVPKARTLLHQTKEAR